MTSKSSMRGRRSAGMPYSPRHSSGAGRRRAETRQRAVMRGLEQKAGLAAVATGLVALVALPAAQAETHDHLAAQPASKTQGQLMTPTASADVKLDFGRPSTSSKAAPEPAQGSGSQVEAASVKPKTAGKQAQGGVTGLAAPLAQLNMSSPFGYRINPLTGAAGEFHNGNDFAAGCETPVKASASGTVVEASSSPTGYGNRIVVDHGGGLKTTYNHLGSMGVQAGQSVDEGERIAGVGTTGNSTGCHLHFEVVVSGQTVDPQTWL